MFPVPGGRPGAFRMELLGYALRWGGGGILVMGIPGIERLRWAADTLRQNALPSSLNAGAAEVWAAMIDLPEWPAALRGRAVELQGSLLRYGTIRMTIGHMCEMERRRLREELVAFVELAESMETRIAHVETSGFSGSGEREVL
jgi:hypothetical protein